MSKQHQYKVNINWTGNKGSGTSHYTAYSRDHIVAIDGKPEIPSSSDPAFRGDASRYNPEEFLVMSLSSCHMLWYLHLCAEAGVIVTDYKDDAWGLMAETADGGGHFTEVTLHPVVTISEASMAKKAEELHTRAHELCFIANSVKFPVKHQPKILVK